ncbi:MAG TPA: TIGR03118 family protein [Gaiellaceae bacterium]
MIATATSLVLAAAGATSGTLVAYNVYPLVSDSAAVSAPLGDASLVNGWGLSASATSPWWASDNKTNSSTLYSGVGSKTALTVTVPGGPTGMVANTSTTDFAVSQNGVSGASRFLFANEAGQILGWTPTVNGTAAIVAVDNSAGHAEYTGLATTNDRLYAADFHNGRVDAYDAGFKPVSLAFSDPKLPKGWAPFGIQALGNNLFVTYAEQDKAKADSVPGGGLGYVDEFTPDGALVTRVASKGNAHAPLNTPWGLALAPSNFGAFSGDLLVGNFGNGRISAYQQLASGKWVYKGQLRVAGGTPITIDGLWALGFGNGASSGPTNSLYFLAGPSGETHGLFGFIATG